MVALVTLILFQTAPIWVTFVLFMMFWHVWMVYVQSDFIFNQETRLLHIKLPKEMMKSPLAMELFLTTLHQTGGESTWYDKIWTGKTRAYFALEMVSIEGKVGFYIWTRKGLKNFIESSLYAQFPGIEVHEVPDYALPVKYDTDQIKFWGAEIELVKPDFFPIKTYVDYGLDKDPKEEFKVDPISPVLEFLGSIGANQQAWMQICIRAYKPDDYFVPGMFFKNKYDILKEEAYEYINNLMSRDPKTRISGDETTAGFQKSPSLTEGEKETIEAIERNLTKLQFDACIRLAYFGKKEFFNPTNIAGMIGSWKQYASNTLNGFKFNGGDYSPKPDYAWDDYQDKLMEKSLKRFIDAYKRRNHFYPPVRGRTKKWKKIILSSEELATIYHFPGQVAAAPGVTRILSKKSEAPSNLPI